jgi:hypothetical protein
MPAAWSTPRTWVTGEALLASDLNAQVRDNVSFLKEPPFSLRQMNEAADYVTSATSMVEVDGSNSELSLTISTGGGNVLVVFFGTFSHSALYGRCQLDVEVDGVMLGGDNGLIQSRSPIAGTSGAFSVSFAAVKTGLAPGSHTFKLMWATSGASLTLYAGAGTSGFDHHPQFWVREI